MSESAPSYHRHVRSIAAFVVGYALVDLLPVILPKTPVFIGLRVSDVADAVLVFALAALYVQLGLRGNLWRSGTLRATYAVALAMMVQGHAIHLAGDAISSASAPADSAWDLIYFLDERWGHIELHLSFLLVAWMFIRCASPTRADVARIPLSRTEEAALLILSLTYGVLLAGDAVEGQTWALMLPAAVLLGSWGFLPYFLNVAKSRQPVVSLYRRFFAASFVVTAVSLIVYGVVAGGFPELSALGEVAR
jgi:hypothetical protein